MHFVWVEVAATGTLALDLLSKSFIPCMSMFLWTKLNFHALHVSPKTAFFKLIENDTEAGDGECQQAPGAGQSQAFDGRLEEGIREVAATRETISPIPDVMESDSDVLC